MNTPINLMSLLEMLKIYAHQYVQLGRLVHEHGGRLYMATPEDGDPGRPLNDADVKELKQHLAELSLLCHQLGLKIAKRGVERALTDLPKTDREYDALVSVVMHELEEQLFLFVPANRSTHYQSDFGIPAFPAASTELVHAGNCYAVGEFTACVFHTMRAAEVALDAVRVNLGLGRRDINDRSWGNICRDIKDGISGKGRAWAKQDDYNAIHATLVAIKDSWRNQTMHVASSYSEQDALSIHENTKMFILRLTRVMDESGQPPA